MALAAQDEKSRCAPGVWYVRAPAWSWKDCTHVLPTASRSEGADAERGQRRSALPLAPLGQQHQLDVLVVGPLGVGDGEEKPLAPVEEAGAEEVGPEKRPQPVRHRAH